MLYSFRRVTPVLDHHNGGGCPSFCCGNVRRRYGSLLRWVSLAERRYAHESWLHSAVTCRNAFRLDCVGTCDYRKWKQWKRSPVRARLATFSLMYEDSRHRWSFYTFMIAILKKLSMLPTRSITVSLTILYDLSGIYLFVNILRFRYICFFLFFIMLMICNELPRATHPRLDVRPQFDLNSPTIDITISIRPTTPSIALII